MTAKEERLARYQRALFEFLDDEVSSLAYYLCTMYIDMSILINLIEFRLQNDKGKYMALVKDMISGKSKRLIINIKDVFAKGMPACVAAILDSSCEGERSLVDALKILILKLDPNIGDRIDAFHIGFEGIINRFRAKRIYLEPSDVVIE